MKKNNILNTVGLGLAISALMALQAKAATSYEYEINFSGGGLTGSGLVFANNAGQVQSGTFDITASPGAYTGVYNLLLPAPGSIGSTLLGFIAYSLPYDNLLTVSGSPNLSYGGSGGLAFKEGTHYVDLFASTGGGYSFGLATGATQAGANFTTVGTSGASSFSFTAVPEVSVFAIAGVGMLASVFMGRKLFTRRSTCFFGSKPA